VKKTSRKISIESLESRLAFDGSWQNVFLPNDVDGSQEVSPLDVLQIINELNISGPRDLVGARPPDEPFCDVNGDLRLDPTDVLAVVDSINRTRLAMFGQAALDTTLDLNGNGTVLSQSVRLAGKTVPRAFVDYVDPISRATMRTQASDSGDFGISLELVQGFYDLQITTMDDLGRKLPMVSPVRVGNVVHEWNAAVLNVIRDWRGVTDDPVPGTRFTSEPPKVGRNMAMIQGAMFDAINSIDRTYDSFLFQGTASNPVGIDARIAASYAAYHVARHLYPSFLGAWDTTLAECLASVPDAGQLNTSMEFGQEVAMAVVAARADDGSDSKVDYVPGDQPGDWNRTLPAFLAPLLPQWPEVIPFAMSAPNQFLAPPPPALDTEAYATAVDEVMKLGSKSNSTRTADQTEIAVFWADGGGTFTPPGHWNRIATDASLGSNQNLIESARTLALLNIALADAGISCWDTKYEYGLWRPIDAIRKAETDANAMTHQDASWLPLLVTPPFPAYTSGHSTFSGASAEILTAIFGASFSFASQKDLPTNTSQLPYDPSKRILRSFGNFYQAAEEASWSRIYGGIHFLFDGTEGLKAGYSIGALVHSTMLRRKMS
jgi:hypothetical protein